jgi:hypothetical protein
VRIGRRRRVRLFDKENQEHGARLVWKKRLTKCTSIRAWSMARGVWKSWAFEASAFALGAGHMNMRQHSSMTADTTGWL